MRPRLALLVALLAVATLGLTSATGAAITVRPGGAITSSGTLTFSNSFASIACAVTLTENITAGTYAVGARFGSVTGARLVCTGGGGNVPVVVLNLPWGIFMGNLAAGLMHKLIPIQILFTIGAIRCLYDGRLGTNTNGVQLIVNPALVLAPQNLALTSPLCTSPMNIAGGLTLNPGFVITLP